MKYPMWHIYFSYISHWAVYDIKGYKVRDKDGYRYECIVRDFDYYTK